MQSIMAIFCCLMINTMAVAGEFDRDTLVTAHGDLIITFIGHGTLMFTYNNLVIHVDPVGRYADYSQMPDADIILVTHHHGDHFDPAAIELLKKPDTKLILTQTCFDTEKYGTVLKNGEETTIKGIDIKAVPAYNLVHKRKDGEPFHPKGDGNGYVLNFSGFRVYIAGDTENIPEMKAIRGVDCAFLPMNLPYTMTPEMVADAVDLLKPKILYPYHFGDTDTGKLLNLLKDQNKTEIRIRNMQ